MWTKRFVRVLAKRRAEFVVNMVVGFWFGCICLAGFWRKVGTEEIKKGVEFCRLIKRSRRKNSTVSDSVINSQ